LPGVLEISGREVSPAGLTEVFTAGLGARLAANWLRGELPAEIAARARALQQEKYASGQWTDRR
jgi:hypothetical protein